MKKFLLVELFIATFLLTASPAFAATADLSQITTFIQSVIQGLAALSGLVATGFFVLGGFNYIMSSGNPQSLETAKKTISYAAIGLVITLGAFVLSGIVTQLATTAFGK